MVGVQDLNKQLVKAALKLGNVEATEMCSTGMDLLTSSLHAQTHVIYQDLVTPPPL